MLEQHQKRQILKRIIIPTPLRVDPSPASPLSGYAD